MLCVCVWCIGCVYVMACMCVCSYVVCVRMVLGCVCVYDGVYVSVSLVYMCVYYVH